MDTLVRHLVTVMTAFVAAAATGPVQDPPPLSQPDFAIWLEGVRAEALQRGISQKTVERAFDGLEPEPIVVARDRAQPEQVQSLDTYLKERLSPRTLKSANEMQDKYRDVLTRIDARYGVPPEMMIAIWGIESNFGKFTGSRP